MLKESSMWPCLEPSDITEISFCQELVQDELIVNEELGVPFTIHAGEADGAESVRCAISYGASRIGHGVRSVESEEILFLLLL